MSKVNATTREEAERLLWQRTHDTEWMTHAMQAAVRRALLDHKRKGQPIVEWKDGKVVWTPADQIDIGKPMKRMRMKSGKIASQS